MRRKLDFEEWIQMGMKLGYCTKPVCATHDGLPSTPDEDATWEVGGDPCVAAVRLLRGDEQFGHEPSRPG